MNHANTKAPSGRGHELLDIPPSSAPDDGVVITPPIEEQRLPLVPMSESAKECDVDALKVVILGCFPSVPHLPKGCPAPGSRYTDPANRFSSAERTPSEPHQWPPRPSSINTVEYLSHQMKTAIIPEIQLPVACFRVFSDGTLFIEGGFGKDIIKNKLAGRYNKSNLSVAEHMERIKKAFAIWRREKDEPTRYTLKAKVENENLQAALSRWETSESSKRPLLPVVGCPRRTWIFYNDRRVYRERVHFAELNIPESIVDGDDVEWRDEGIMIRATTGRKILEKATLFVPEDDPLLRDFDTLITISDSDDEKNAAVGESTTSEVDIVKYHLSHGRWMWIYHTNRLQDPDINTTLAEDYELARFYHVAKGDPYLIKKLCNGVSLSRNDRILLHSFGIKRIQCDPLLTYANILCQKEEKRYKPDLKIYKPETKRYEPEVNDVRIVIPPTARIDCTQENRIMQTMKGQPISESPSPVYLEAIPEPESPPKSPEESPKESPKRISNIFSRVNLPASPPNTPPKSSLKSSPKSSSLFSRKSSKRSSKSAESIPSKPSKFSNPSKSSRRSKTSPTKKRIRKLKRRVRRALSRSTPRVDLKGKGPAIPEPDQKTRPKKYPVPKYGAVTCNNPVNINNSPRCLNWHTTIPAPYSHRCPEPESPLSPQSPESPEEKGYEPCPACTLRASGSQHTGNCWRPFVQRVDWSRYPDWNAIKRQREKAEFSRRLRSLRLRIKVEKEVFVRVRGASFSKDGNGEGKLMGRRYASSVPEFSERMFESPVGGETTTTISYEPPKSRVSVGVTKRSIFSSFSLTRSFSKRTPIPKSSSSLVPPLAKTSSLTAEAPLSITATNQDPKDTPQNSQEIISDNSAGETPPLQRLPSSRSSMSFDGEGLVDAKEGALKSLEDLGVVVKRPGFY